TGIADWTDACRRRENVPREPRVHRLKRTTIVVHPQEVTLMNELGAGISIGVLAALVVFVIYLIAAKLGRWQPRSQSGGPGTQGGYGPGGYSQPTRAWSSEDETRVLPANARGYDAVG